MRTIVICGIFLAFYFNSLKAQRYEGYKVIEIQTTTATDLQLLQKLSQDEQKYDFLSLSRSPGDKARVMISPLEFDRLKNLLSTNGLAYEVVNENFRKFLEQDYKDRQRLSLLYPYTGTGRLGTQNYHSHADINSYIDDLALRFPKRVNVKTFGWSYQKRALKTILISNGEGRANKNVILMDGGFHAREWMSPAAVVYAIEQLVENFEQHAELLLDYDWVVLPIVNADGYEYTREAPDTRMWRKTRQPVVHEGKECIGTDPNRNFDFHWNETGASADPCSNTYAGPRAFSEPEVVVVRDIMHTLRGRGKMYLTVHTYGALILYPWGWSELYPDTWEDLHEVAKVGKDAIFEATGTNYTIGQSTVTLYAAAGAADDYAFNDGFPIAFTMELPAGGPEGHDPPPHLIDSYVKETWVGIRAMAKRVTEKYPL